VVADPHGLGAAVARLGAPSRQAAGVALGIASVSLDEGELVEMVIQGQIDGVAGLGLLTDRRLLLVNEAAWVPLVETIEIGPALQVAGEADNRRATVTLTTPAGTRVVADSRDVDLAKELAARLRARTAAS